jgi:hypothetical protein
MDAPSSNDLFLAEKPQPPGLKVRQQFSLAKSPLVLVGPIYEDTLAVKIEAVTNYLTYGFLSISCRSTSVTPEFYPNFSKNQVLGRLVSLCQRPPQTHRLFQPGKRYI